MKNILSFLSGIKYLAVLVLFFNITACSDEFFELEAPPEHPWVNNLNEFEKAAAGVYNQALRGAGWNSTIGASRLVKSTMVDVAQLLPGVIGAIPFNEMYYRLSDVENNKTAWSFRWGYHIIVNANAVLDFLAEHDGNPFPSIGPNDLQHNLRRVEGEMHFLRGWAYWHLATMFIPPYEAGGSNSDRIIPLRMHFDNNIVDAKTPTLGSTEEIYQLMVEDFTKAKSLLPERFDPALHHQAYQYGRANRFAAAAMLAKVYFAMDRSQEAMGELNYVIDQNGGDYDLSEDPIEAFNRDDHSRGKEVILYADYHDLNHTTYPLEVTSMNLQFDAMNGGWTHPNGFARCTWAQFAWSYTVLEQVGWMTDPLNGDYSLTPEGLADKRLHQVYRLLQPYSADPNADPSVTETVVPELVNPVVWCDKYFRGRGVGMNTNVPVIRLADLYLLRSLARFRSGDPSGATNDLNIVRNRAGIGDLPRPITEDEIHNERIKEMAFEGDRIEYVRLLAKIDLPPGDRNTAPVPYNSHELIWELPQQEYELSER